jgi:hypothetical protein
MQNSPVWYIKMATPLAFLLLLEQLLLPLESSKWELEADRVNASHHPKKKVFWYRLSVGCVRTSKAHSKSKGEFKFL